MDRNAEITEMKFLLLYIVLVLFGFQELRRIGQSKNCHVSCIVKNSQQMEILTLFYSDKENKIIQIHLICLLNL